MRGVWKYVLGAYLAFVLLSVIASRSFMFLLLLLLLVAIVFGRRAARTSTFRLSWTSGTRPELDSGEPATSLVPHVGVDRHRFADERREFELRFPEDPLDSPQMVEILSAYRHEPDEARREVEDEYRTYQRRFLDWRTDVDALVSVGDARVPAETERLRATAVDLRRFVESLDRRAEESQGLLERALEAMGRADDALARARNAYTRLAPADRATGMTERLDEAEQKLRLARQALAKDAERPVTALRLCAEAVSAANSVDRRARTLVELPAELDTRRGQFEAERTRVERELARVKEDFQASAQMYAPSSWLEVRGAGAAADRAMARARRRWESAARELDADRFEEASAELDEAFASLERTSELIRKIDAHLAALEAAALGARERIADAEKEIDQAWAEARRLPAPEGPERRDQPLQRAAELAERARTEIEKERPDWLTVTELAERSMELARATRGVDAGPDDADPDLTQLLQDSKGRAKDARDSAWAWAIVSSGPGSPATQAIDSAVAAFSAALRLEAAIPASGSRAERARAINEAVDAFRSAERAATAAAEEAEAERSRRPRTRGLGFSEGQSQSGSAEALVWGALGLAALLADD